MANVSIDVWLTVSSQLEIIQKYMMVMHVVQKQISYEHTTRKYENTKYRRMIILINYEM